MLICNRISQCANFLHYGIQVNAEPLEDLIQAQKEFQKRRQEKNQKSQSIIPKNFLIHPETGKECSVEERRALDYHKKLAKENDMKEDPVKDAAETKSCVSGIPLKDSVVKVDPPKNNMIDENAVVQNATKENILCENVLQQQPMKENIVNENTANQLYAKEIIKEEEFVDENVIGDNVENITHDSITEQILPQESDTITKTEMNTTENYGIKTIDNPFLSPEAKNIPNTSMEYTSDPLSKLHNLLNRKFDEIAVVYFSRFLLSYIYASYGPGNKPSAGFSFEDLQFCTLILDDAVDLETEANIVEAMESQFFIKVNAPWLALGKTTKNDTIHKLNVSLLTCLSSMLFSDSPENHFNMSSSALSESRSWQSLKYFSSYWFVLLQMIDTNTNERLTEAKLQLLLSISKQLILDQRKSFPSLFLLLKKYEVLLYEDNS